MTAFREACQSWTRHVQDVSFPLTRHRHYLLCFILSNLMVFCCSERPQDPNQFDVKAFCDTVHDIGKAYRHRAIELIKICRRFSAASDQSFRQATELSK